VLSFFAALGFAILIGVKISVTIAWTLPFVILGLGVDDMVRLYKGTKERLITNSVSDSLFAVY
jgi:predicted RND superfamily exporter protein